MFENLNSLLGVESRPLKQQKFVHISSDVESGLVNASFLVHHFISSFIKHGYKVLLVSCLNTFSQYKIIQTKLGVNLDQTTTQENFTFISALNLRTEVQTDGDTCYGFSQPVESQHTSCFTKMSESITEEIRSKLEGIKSGQDEPFLIVFDELSTLTDLGCKAADVLNMICKVKALYPHTFTTFLTSCCRFDPNIMGVDICSLSNQLTHWSDLTFDVAQLSTGVSKDVHGQLKVCRRNSSPMGDRQETYHYKVTERDLKLFAVGESPAVL